MWLAGAGWCPTVAAAAVNFPSDTRPGAPSALSIGKVSFSVFRVIMIRLMSQPRGPFFKIVHTIAI